MYIIKGGNKYEQDGMVTFRTKSQVGKQDIKDYLQALYGLVPKKIATVNFEGRWKKKGNVAQKTVGYKKVLVWFDKEASMLPIQAENIEFRSSK
jgi:ribosomal protein L23